jgi:hypothetical protein
MPEPTDPAPANAPEPDSLLYGGAIRGGPPRTPSPCTDCGADELAFGFGTHSWKCGSSTLNGMKHVSRECLDRQLAALRAAVARLEGERDEWIQAAHNATRVAGHSFDPEPDIAKDQLCIYAEAFLRVAALESALAGSVPKAVALRACLIAFDACYEDMGETHNPDHTAARSVAQAKPNFNHVRTMQIASGCLERALAEHEADRAASATQGDPAGTKGATDG